MNDIFTSEFSKRTSLSIRALRLYDAEQLLQPSRVDPATGYRYYSPEQLGLGQLIRQLRRCEMPLEQVRIVLRVPQGARAELIAHKAHLQQRLSDHQQMLEQLETLISERRGDLEAGFRGAPTQPIVLIQSPLSWMTRRESAEIGCAIAALQAYVCPTDDAGEPFLMCGCTMPPIDRQSVNDIWICFLTKSLYQPQGEIGVLELPATKFAYIIHHGAYTTLQATLERLLSWIVVQEFSSVGDARETYLKHPANSGGVDEYRTELAIRVERTVNSSQRDQPKRAR